MSTMFVDKDPNTPITAAWLNSIEDLRINFGNLSNITAVDKGAAMVGRAIQVVDSVAALKTLLKTSPSRYARTSGYYTANDGGSSIYFLDLSDTTSADNGGTVIVAADGGRWKITQVVPIDIRQFGCKGGGVTNDTTQAQAFLTAIAGKSGTVGAGIYRILTLTMPTQTRLFGNGADTCQFKRLDNAAGNLALMDISAATGVYISGLGFDGNKAAQVNSASSLGIFSSDDVTISECLFTNAKAVGGANGSGIVMQNGTGQANARAINIRFIRFASIDGVDVFVQKVWYVNIHDNFMKGSGGGVSVINFVFPPVAEVQNFIKICNNDIRDQAGSGILVNGYVESGTSPSNVKLGPGVPPQRYCLIEGNILAQCTAYGVAFQGSNSIIANNNAYLCGSVPAGGGFLMNAQSCIFQGNTARDCYHYGVDAGGSYSCSILNNNFLGNCATYGASGTDINVGGAFNVLVQGNVIEQVGSQQMDAIAALGIEGDGVAPFPLPAGTGEAIGLQIIGNKIQLNGAAASIGVWVYGSQERVTVQCNHVRGAVGPNQAFILEAVKLITANNVDESTYANGSPVQAITAQAALVLPDVGNVFIIGGNTGITSIQSYSGNQNLGKIRACQASAHGIGYSRTTPPTVSFAGGGGTGLAATAQVSYNGEVVSWNVTNKGNGYTSAPTPTIIHNGGSGANCVPQLGCANFEGREITLNFTGTLTVANGGNLVLNGNYNATPGKVLRLMGLFGNWYEISRS